MVRKLSWGSSVTVCGTEGIHTVQITVGIQAVHSVCKHDKQTAPSWVSQSCFCQWIPQTESDAWKKVFWYPIGTTRKHKKKHLCIVYMYSRVNLAVTHSVPVCKKWYSAYSAILLPSLWYFFILEKKKASFFFSCIIQGTMLELLPLTEFGAKYNFYQKLYEAFMRPKALWKISARWKTRKPKQLLFWRKGLDFSLTHFSVEENLIALILPRLQ